MTGQHSAAGSGKTPQHGDKRHQRQEASYGKHIEYVDSRTGETVYSGPLWGATTPVHERYCDRCGAWQTMRGIEAVLWPACPSCEAPFEDWMRKDGAA